MSDIPASVHSGVLRLGSAEIKVHVLDNGQRVVTADGLRNFRRWLEGDLGEATPEQLAELAKFAKGR